MRLNASPATKHIRTKHTSTHTTYVFTLICYRHFRLSSTDKTQPKKIYQSYKQKFTAADNETYNPEDNGGYRKTVYAKTKISTHTDIFRVGWLA